MLAKFHGDQRLIVILLINYLNSSFCSLKLFIKNESMDYIVNNIWLAWKFTCILSIYKTCNSMVGFFLLLGRHALYFDKIVVRLDFLE